MANREKLTVGLVVLVGGLFLTGCAVQAPSELMKAVRKGDLDYTKSILEANPKLVNSKNEWGHSPMQLAVIEGNKDMCALLIDKGANLEIRNHYGQTPLHVAVEANHKEVVKFLIEKGADVNAKSKGGCTPIPCGFGSRIVHLQDFDWGIVEFLIAHGAEVNIKTKGYGYTPLHVAAMYAPKEIVKLYLDEGANANSKSSNGSTCLHMAVGRADKNVRVVELLVASGADVNAVEKDSGATPLHWACNTGFTTAVEFLITKGADVNAKQPNGNTPMYYAKRQKHKEIANILRKHGAKE